MVLVEDGHPSLVIHELKPVEAAEDIPISARWPKGMPAGRYGLPPVSQDEVLERLNKEIIALKEQIAQEEAVPDGRQASN